MKLVATSLVLASTAHTAAAHGFLTAPAARQAATGITNPGAGKCGITADNQMNNNGCTGGAAYVCYKECENWSQHNSTTCKACVKTIMETVKRITMPKPMTGSMNPMPRVGVCGEPYDNGAFLTAWSGVSGSEYPGKTTDNVYPLTKMTKVGTEGDMMELKMQITAYHYGWSEFRLCESNGGAVTQECFNKHVLEFDADHAKMLYPQKEMADDAPGKGAQQPTDPTDYVALSPHTRCSGPTDDGSTWTVDYLWTAYPKMMAPEGACCNGGGTCSDPKNNTDRWVFPSMSAAEQGAVAVGELGDAPMQGADLEGIFAPPKKMNGVYTVRLKIPDNVDCDTQTCTVQWLFMTGNSVDGYPEAFRNCADFTMVGDASPDDDEAADQGPSLPVTFVPISGWTGDEPGVAAGDSEPVNGIAATVRSKLTTTTTKTTTTPKTTTTTTTTTTTSAAGKVPQEHMLGARTKQTVRKSTGGKVPQEQMLGGKAKRRR